MGKNICAKRQWSKTRQIYKKKSEQGKELKRSRWVLNKAVQKQISANLNETKQCCKEQRAKIPSQSWRRLRKSNRKRIIDVKDGSTSCWWSYLKFSLSAFRLSRKTWATHSDSVTFEFKELVSQLGTGQLMDAVRHWVLII